jgi:hypothetical protein
MKNLILILAITYCYVSCYSVKEIDESYQLNSYKIIKLDSINNVYVLSAMRLDTLYKILSYKDSSNKCRSIFVNNTYKLNLKSLFIRGFIDSSGRRFDITPEAVPGLTGFEYHGVLVSIEDLPNQKRDLFEATNLRGLCFIKDNK